MMWFSGPLVSCVVSPSGKITQGSSFSGSKERLMHVCTWVSANTESDMKYGRVQGCLGATKDQQRVHVTGGDTTPRGSLFVCLLRKAFCSQRGNLFKPGLLECLIRLTELLYGFGSTVEVQRTTRA